ncbi:MAG: FMN-binding glutamate synthase family protein [Proteobacteria bacterium]|nr:FMN-binding glutamate synthase family protein [Pseudomonadota bacterium]
MARRLFFYSSFISILLVIFIYPFKPHVLYFLFLIIPYIALGIYDLYFSVHNVLRIYPVIGHLRYLFEFVRPEIQQYFVATNLSGRPYNREIRDLIYQRAKNVKDTIPFGTQYDITEPQYELAYHSLDPKIVSESVKRLLIGGPDCKKPYLSSRLNVSAMSYGSLSKNAIMALNLGCKEGDFAQDTGEGGLTEYHLKYGGNLVWEIGSGYFGVRTKDGHFDPEKFREQAALDNVKMIAIKLSQGAKPGHGGVLPAAKVTEEIARIRGVEAWKDCVSPPKHSTFSTPEGLLRFVQQLRELSGGKPVGFKLCIGIRKEFMGICKAMLKTGIMPDFITVDGAEGGTGAAPVELVDHIGMPINEGIAFADNCLIGVNLRDKIKLFASGKIATGFDMVTKIALGADACNVARPMMFALGCIQALRCNTNTCPTGVTTHDPLRERAIVIEDKYKHVMNYHDATLKNFMHLLGVLGLDDPKELKPEHIMRRNTEGYPVSYAEIFDYLKPGELLTDSIHTAFARDWALASAEKF